MDAEIAKAQEERKKLEQQLASEQLASLNSVTFDTDLYGGNNPFEGYEKSIPVNEDEENLDIVDSQVPRRLASYTAPKSIMNDMPRGGDDDEALGFKKPQKIIDREDDYRRRRLNRVISPERHDAFANEDKTLDVSVRTYADVMREEALKRKKEETLKLIADKKKEEEAEKEKKPADSQATQMRRNRWDQSQEDLNAKKAKAASDWDLPDSTPGIGRWDATPTPGRVGDATPSLSRKNRWDETPTPGRVADSDATPIGGGLTPLLATPTPMGTPLYAIPEENRGQQFDVPKELPGGFFFFAKYGLPGGLPFMKPEDYLYFGALLNEEDEEELSPDEQKERKIMKLLLKVKNGTPPQHKTALRQLTDKAREFGAGPLFNRILPLLMQPTLEDQERHLLVKVIDRVIYKLDELVRPCVHKILVVIEPLLIDEDYHARVEGREIIYNLSKAAGLATMIAAMRPDIDSIDENVRNTTARAFSVVASALGIPALLPFLKAVCQSKKSWQARHTGIMIVQQIAILVGCAVLPHLRSLVEIIEHGLNDENQKVRTITALSLAALAEASAP